ncbi:MAG: citrate/2-methylcitrate synthase [Firmicutes bacterium]|nr:citrate/2-methylcitrate synthase [Bacillota bacterium]
MIIHHTHPNYISEEGQFARDHAAHWTEENGIDPELFKKYPFVKRGLRNANGSGVVVGLTKVGDVEGYRFTDTGEKIPAEGKLYYRGIDVEDLVNNCLAEDRFGYEETSYLLLFGHLPNKKELDEYTKLLGKKRRLPDGFARDMILTAPSRSIMNKLARSVLALYSYDSNPDDTSLENVIRQSIDLVGYFPSLIAYGYQAQQSQFFNKSLHLHQPDPDMSTAETILRLLRPTGEYTDLEAKLLDISLIIHAEHGAGNNSSFTTHLVSSTGTDTYSAIAAAVGSLKGPKHGGANLAVPHMMEDMRRNVLDLHDYSQIQDYLVKVLRKEANDKTGLIYGLGHAVYTLSDPRAKLLKGMAKRLADEQGLQEEFALYSYIEEVGPDLFREVHKSDKPICANVDLYSAFVYKALNIPQDVATPLFATARISGWCAHRIEELSNSKIMRPAYQTAQPLRNYTPLSDR